MASGLQKIDGIEIGPWVRIRSPRWRYEVWIYRGYDGGWKLVAKPTWRLSTALFAAAVIAGALRDNPPFTEPLDDPQETTHA
jgi:hypothetical protein